MKKVVSLPENGFKISGDDFSRSIAGHTHPSFLDTNIELVGHAHPSFLDTNIEPVTPMTLLLRHKHRAGHTHDPPS